MPLPFPAVLDKAGESRQGQALPQEQSLRMLFKEQEALPLNILYWPLRFYFNFLNNNIDNLHTDLDFSWIHIIKLRFPKVTGHKAQEMNTMTSVTARQHTDYGSCHSEISCFWTLYSSKLLIGIFFEFKHRYFTIQFCPILNINRRKRGVR